MTVTPRAIARLEGAVYSVPSRWAALDLVVRIGATTVTIVGKDGTRIPHPRKRFGQRSIDYRHYPVGRLLVAAAGARCQFRLGFSPVGFRGTMWRVLPPSAAG